MTVRMIPKGPRTRMLAAKRRKRIHQTSQTHHFDATGSACWYLNTTKVGSGSTRVPPQARSLRELYRDGVQARKPRSDSGKRLRLGKARPMAAASSPNHLASVAPYWSTDVV